MTSSSWDDRYPNPHTRPDPDDPLARKVRADSKKLFGFDPLETRIDTVDYINALREKHTQPEYQEAAAAGRQAERERLAKAKGIEYRRRIERLSPEHVQAVLAGCDPDLTPVTTTDIQRKARAQWDGVQSMFLLGETSVGKTYTAVWCAMRAARGGRDVAATTATRVCEATPDQRAVLRAVDVLVIDQLHALSAPSGKSLPAWQVGPVIDLIDYRYEQQRTTIAAGTVSPEKIFGSLGEDVRRRFPLRLMSNATGIQTPKEPSK